MKLCFSGLQPCFAEPAWISGGVGGWFRAPRSNFQTVVSEIQVVAVVASGFKCLLFPILRNRSYTTCYLNPKQGLKVNDALAIRILDRVTPRTALTELVKRGRGTVIPIVIITPLAH